MYTEQIMVAEFMLMRKCNTVYFTTFETRLIITLLANLEELQTSIQDGVGSSPTRKYFLF